ncbi:glucosamine-6-phosphate deaminase [Pseudalkalibacillus decolorationis]|uniref:glucosamine-6-phosphate deaminase n=1 Tax=Pseudalkalibacillus decolorationis TaxID=163879 RepID=UPI0021491F00|nr:glucosamine-6-phosphate deaminase [Pseudalkalibacillus decolorationis]
MNIIETTNYSTLSEKAAILIFNQIKSNPRLVLGAATGDTPKGTYEQLVNRVKREGLNLSNINTVNLDEYVGLNAIHPQSYWNYMQENLYTPLNLSKDQAFIPDGTAVDLEDECDKYEQRIERIGGIDLQILGIGRNGHIGFNEPFTSFSSRTHIVTLTESTRKANARFFSNIKEVPTRAITMGISTIMKSKSIVLLASGEGKAAAVDKLLSGKVDPAWPATILNEHPNVTLIVDNAAKNR